jgi:decaprenylphospho-beta-D-ribofuranose 2-oxidase
VSRVYEVESPAHIATALEGAGSGGLIARGFARSYGDVCLNSGGDVVDTRRLASLHHFDPESGTLVCDAGVSFRTLMQKCVPAGWLPAVCPGTAWVSMGGAVANDIHGKNHHVAGSFGDHVDWMELRLPSGEVRRITPSSDPDLFRATLGGIGLTGIIQRLQLRLTPIPSNAMQVRETRVRDLDSFLEQLQQTESQYPYAVGWVDALSGGSRMGRGILQLARPADRGVRQPGSLSLAIPFDFPSWVLNRHTVGAFNLAYFNRVPAGGRTRPVHVSSFLYPLDLLRDWNRMYGRMGVYQFQCLVPFQNGRRALIHLMEEITRSRGASFLAVLKTMGRTGRGMLSFSSPGFTLALDFARRPHTRQLIERLQEITLSHGGRIYLAKDACLTAEQVRVMYPGVDAFRAVIRSVDPEGRMQSDMSRRLRLDVTHP